MLPFFVSIFFSAFVIPYNKPICQYHKIPLFEGIFGVFSQPRENCTARSAMSARSGLFPSLRSSSRPDLVQIPTS